MLQVRFHRLLTRRVRWCFIQFLHVSSNRFQSWFSGIVAKMTSTCMFRFYPLLHSWERFVCWWHVQTFLLCLHFHSYLQQQFFLPRCRFEGKAARRVCTHVWLAWLKANHFSKQITCGEQSVQCLRVLCSSYDPILFVCQERHGPSILRCISYFSAIIPTIISHLCSSFLLRCLERRVDHRPAYFVPAFFETRLEKRRRNRPCVS